MRLGTSSPDLRRCSRAGSLSAITGASRVARTTVNGAGGVPKERHRRRGRRGPAGRDRRRSRATALQRLVIGERDSRIAALVVEAVSAEEPLSELEAGSARRGAIEDKHEGHQRSLLSPRARCAAWGSRRTSSGSSSVAVLRRDHQHGEHRRSDRAEPDAREAVEDDVVVPAVAGAPAFRGAFQTVKSDVIRTQILRRYRSSDHVGAAHGPELHPLRAERLRRTCAPGRGDRGMSSVMAPSAQDPSATYSSASPVSSKNASSATRSR